ncbi:MAG: hypothetical protein ACP5I4_13530 [Oceanipulchritudo sp.]
MGTRIGKAGGIFPLESHPAFTRWEDPESGAVSYILTKRIAEYQKAWYFMEPGLRGGNPALWFYACHPPAKQWYSCAVRLDADDPEIKAFPNTLANGNPMLAPGGDTAYVPVEDGIHEQSLDGTCRERFRLPPDVLGGRHLFSLVTDLNLSCDGKTFLLDCQIGNRWLIATVDRESGAFRPLRWFGNRHHHAVFSKHDPDLFMVNLGHWTDPITGDKFQMNNRIWIMDTKLTRYAPLLPDAWFGQNSATCHEWWTPEGRIAYCDYTQGVLETDPDTRQTRMLWERHCTHAQSDPTHRFFVGDHGCYKWNAKEPCSVWFFNSETGRETPVVTRMPPPPMAWRDFRAYHIDPHPCFSGDGEWITYTTTAPGFLTVALAPVAHLTTQTS